MSHKECCRDNQNYGLFHKPNELSENKSNNESNYTTEDDNLLYENELDITSNNELNNELDIGDYNLLYNKRDEEKGTLKKKLHIWATDYNVTHTSLTALLCILRKEGHDDLPSDARTLLATPKNTIIRECGTGHYFHYGLEKALREKMEYYKKINNNIIEININIDGLPLAKSSQSQLWPVLGQIYI